MMKNVCKNIYTLIRECVKLLFSRQEFFVGFPKNFELCDIYVEDASKIKRGCIACCAPTA